MPVKRYVKMASKLDFGSAIFLGKGKSRISAGKIISHSREDGLLHRFFSPEDWPFAAPLSISCQNKGYKAGNIGD